MTELLSTLIPLDIASTLSPGIFALAIVLLGGKWHPRARTGALLFGILLVGVLTTCLGFSLGQATGGQGETQTKALINIALGIFFLFFGIKVLVSRERKIKESTKDTGKQGFKWLIIGIVIAATNFDALFLNFAAAKEVGQTAGIDFWLKIALLVFNLFFFILPILLPLVIFILFPVAAGRVLHKINFYVIKYSRYLIFGLFVLLGIMFIVRGVKFFI